MDPVVAVFAGDSNQPLTCLDDAPGESYSSEFSMRVSPGVYFVQVGAHLDGPEGGPFDIRVDFRPDRDIDKDGALQGVDCNDFDANIKPGLPERVNNDVDENCDGMKAFDRDGDGALAPPAGNDCRDDDARIRPGARDVPGNALDEDCVAPRAPYPKASATFRVRYRFFKASQGEPSHLKFVRLGVRDLQRGSTVTLRCRGSRSCPTGRIVRNVKRGKKVSFLVRYREDLPVKTRIELSVTRPEAIGVVRVLRVRKGGVDDRTLCKWPGKRKLRRCGGNAGSAR
jgi:Putative metal-binding motif